MFLAKIKKKYYNFRSEIYRLSCHEKLQNITWTYYRNDLNHFDGVSNENLRQELACSLIKMTLSNIQPGPVNAHLISGATVSTKTSLMLS